MTRAELCGPLNVTPFFPYASDWKGGKNTSNNRVQEVPVCSMVRLRKKRERKEKRTNKSSCPSLVILSLCRTRPLVNILMYCELPYQPHTGTCAVNFSPVNCGCHHKIKDAVEGIAAELSLNYRLIFRRWFIHLLSRILKNLAELSVYTEVGEKKLLRAAKQGYLRM